MLGGEHWCWEASTGAERRELVYQLLCFITAAGVSIYLQIAVNFFPLNINGHVLRVHKNGSYSIPCSVPFCISRFTHYPVKVHWQLVKINLLRVVKLADLLK